MDEPQITDFKIKNLDELDQEFLSGETSSSEVSSSNEGEPNANELLAPTDEVNVDEPAYYYPKKTTAQRVRSITFNVIFYSLIIIVAIGVFLFAGDETGMPRRIQGYSVLRVLTGSMQRELPQGSIIVTQVVDPHSLVIGDNITFIEVENNNRITTHKIYNIFRSSENPDQLRFQTIGTENNLPDDDLVHQNNIIGKVIYHNLFLGRVVNFFRVNTLYIVIFTVLIIGLYIALKYALGSSRRRQYR